jgi:methanogenic corrinoid protein MtbC1
MQTGERSLVDTSSQDDIATELLGELRDRVDERDRAGAVGLVLDAVESGRIGIPELYTQVLGPYLAQVGASWCHGTESVWQEHLASHTVLTIIEALYPTVLRIAAEAPATGRSVLLACPPQERHELGLRMLSDRFELAGWNVTNLGADTPLLDIVAAAHATRPELVALSVSTVFERVELRRFIDSLRAALPGVRIVVGGPAFSKDRSWPAEDLLDPAELGLPGCQAEG